MKFERNKDPKEAMGTGVTIEEKNFEKYFNKKVKELKTTVRKNWKGWTFEQFIERIHQCSSIAEYKAYLLRTYQRKECHAFFKRECENRYKECYRCCHHYSEEDKDKFTKEDWDYLKNPNKEIT